MPSNLPDVPAVPRRKRRLRLLFPIVVLFATLVALLPYATSSLARSKLAAELTAQLGTPCRIADFEWGWFSGFDLRGFEVANPPGFDGSHPLLRIDSARVQFSWLRAFAMRFDLLAEVRHFRLWVDENADGSNNLARVLQNADVRVEHGEYTPVPTRTPSSDTPSSDEIAKLLARIRLALSLRDSGIEIRRNGHLLESIADLECSLTKEFEGTSMRATLDASLPATTPGGRAGALHGQADIDGAQRLASGTLRSSHFDLSRYRPLVDAFGKRGDVTALNGVLDGELTFRFDPQKEPRLVTSGDLVVEQPHLAGPLFSGIELKADRWTLKPSIAVRGGNGPGGSAATAVTAVGSHVDFGFLQIDGIEPPAGSDAMAASFALDLQQLAALGGPLAALGDLGGRLLGTVTLPSSLLAGDGDKALADLRALRGVVVDGKLSGARWSGCGLLLADGGATVTLRDGKLQLATDAATNLNTGPIELKFAADAAADAAMPFELTLGWKGGKLAGEAAQLVRWAVPLLAGLHGEAGAFESGVDLQLALRGPLWPTGSENLLQWLDRFSGEGNVALLDGSFAPSAQLSGLGQLLGQQGRLSIDRLAGAFTMHAGTIETRAMRWLSKNKEYGLAGNVHLDGHLDFGLDVTALLQQHKDGKVIAALLGDKPLLAGLGGTLDAPTLAAPDLGKLAADALQQTPRQLLEQQGGELLQRGLDKLFDKLKKKQ